MKILITKFGKSKGTTERLFNDYCKILSSSGYNVSTLSYNDDEIEGDIPASIPKYYIKNYGKWDPIAGWKIRNLVKTISPTIIISHGNRATELMNQFCSFIPIISVCHNANSRSLVNSERIIATGDNIRQALIFKNIDPDNIYCGFEPIFLPEYNNTVDEQILDKKILTIGVISRLKLRNGHKTLLKAVSILQNRGIKINVMIASTGSEEAALKIMAEELMISNIIIFCGWVEDKQSFFDSIDILCIPALSGSLAHAVLEGFASGLPVIASDIECHREVVSEKNALLVQGGEPDSLALAIEQLHNDRKLAQGIAKNGRQYMLENFQSDALALQIYQILDSIAGDSAFV